MPGGTGKETGAPFRPSKNKIGERNMPEQQKRRGYMAGYPEREQEPHGAYAPAGMARESVTPPASNNVKTIDLVELMFSS